MVDKNFSVITLILKNHKNHKNYKIKLELIFISDGQNCEP